MRLNITPKDVKASKIVRPGWYLAVIEEVKEELAKDKESTNIVVDFTGEEGDANGVPFKVWFSEKYPAGAIPFVKATGGRVSEDEGLDPDYDFERQRGKKVKIHVVTDRGKDGQGKPRNSIDDFAPAAGAAVAEAAPAVGGFEV